MSGDDCHWIAPVKPVNVIGEGTWPMQIDWLADAVPPTLVGATFTVTIWEFVQLKVLVTVTVWLVVIVGFTAITGLFNEPGFHT